MLSASGWASAAMYGSQTSDLILASCIAASGHSLTARPELLWYGTKFGPTILSKLWRLSVERDSSSITDLMIP